MKLIKGKDMFDAVPQDGGKHAICVTTNGIIKSSGDLVMGRGAAGEAATRYPWLPSRAGAAIKAIKGRLFAGFANDYGLAVVDFPDRKDRRFVLVQTKMEWQKPSPIYLVSSSIDNLRLMALKEPETTFHLNYPAIGLGGLPFEVVQPMVEKLPDNVLVYQK